MNNEKIYILEGLGCANCAAKMEAKILAMPEVESAAITFATKQLRIAAPDPSALEQEIQQICQSIEDTVHLVEKTHGTSTSVGSASSKGVSFSREHRTELLTLSLGAVLFLSGLVLEHRDAADIWTDAGTSAVDHIVFILFGVSYLLLGFSVLRTAAGNILRGQIFDENFLMSIATIAAFCIGEFAEGAGVMLFYRIGDLFEQMAVEKSRSQIMEAVDMRPETVALVMEGTEPAEDDCCGCAHDHLSDAVRIIPAGDAKPGDILLVRPGDRIPLDGVIMEGESRIDTSPVTGEPVPVSAYPGASVISGCVNQQGVLKLRVTHPLSESMVTRILDSVENAAAGKPRIDKFITRFARVYTPIVVALAVLTAVIPSLITGQWGLWIKTAITFLVISCPCALVISVPLAFFSGIGAASRLGILFKGGLAIEALKNIKAIVMDKTGTITRGVFEVDSITVFGAISEEDLLTMAASCESASTHPVAASILEKARQLNLSTKTPSSLEELAGMGIRADFPPETALAAAMPGRDPALFPCTVLCGNRRLMESGGIDLPALPSVTGTEILVAIDGALAGQISISDQLKRDSVSAVEKLRSMGLIPAMLTGDNRESAAAVASSCGIEEIRAGLLPEDKVAALQELRGKLGAVMFVGDGINDAPVLAGADVGAAMGSGADAAIEAADVVFMTSSLDAVPQAITIARRTARIAAQNIFFALAVKLLVILLGFAGFANIWAAVFADTGVAMLCILNSLRLLFF